MLDYRYYQHHLLIDQDEETDKKREAIEYAMMFVNYEAVTKVQEARERDEEIREEQIDDVFLDQIQNLFGRDLSGDQIKENRKTATKEPEIDKNNQLNHQLDEIRFGGINKED